MHIEDLQYLSNKYFRQTKTLYWSRMPADFVNKLTGVSVTGASFTGTIREWYETLVETLIDLKNILDIKGLVNVSVGSDVLTILECTVLYKPLFLYDKEGKILIDDNDIPLSHDTLVGTLHGMRIYCNPNQPRNKLLVFNSAQDKIGILEVINMDLV